MIRIEPAQACHAPAIARLVMMAMTDECCLNLVGEGNTLAHFARVMCQLAASAHTQYSYLNTVVALTPDGEVAGAVVSYDGGQLRALRQPFIEAAAREWNVDHSHLKDETSAGEWYIDSLAVEPPYRGQGIARQLLRAAISRAERAGLPAGLLVDKGNPKAERLYRSAGFQYVDDTTWGGHAMRHLRAPLR